MTPGIATPVLILRPSWNQGALFRADNGQPLPMEERAPWLSDAAHGLIADWLCLFRELADPADPQRCALTAPDGPARLQKAARPVMQAIESGLGRGCVHCEPLPTPVLTRHHAPAFRFFPDYDCWPIWFGPGADQVGNISPDELGLSWGLARHIEQWALAFDESLDRDDPGGPGLWSATQYQAHRREGLALVTRMRTEFDATGRSAVALRFEYGFDGAVD